MGLGGSFESLFSRVRTFLCLVSFQSSRVLDAATRTSDRKGICAGPILEEAEALRNSDTAMEVYTRCELIRQFFIERCMCLTLSRKVHGLLLDGVARSRDGHEALEDGLGPEQRLLQHLKGQVSTVCLRSIRRPSWTELTLCMVTSNLPSFSTVRVVV